MRLFVPPLKTKLRLSSPWSFDLHHEHRNEKLFAALGLTYVDWREWQRQYRERTGERWTNTRPPPEQVRLPRGTVLVVDRICIRNGAEDFDSITFRIAECPKAKFKGKPRFWAKLADCNRMNVVVMEEEESSK